MMFLSREGGIGSTRRLRWGGRCRYKAEVFYLADAFLLHMYRKVVAVWVSLVMMFSFAVIVDDLIPLAKAATITVDDSGGADYLTIQEAIDAANPMDTVFVYSGNYRENVVVDKTLDLIGEDRNTTVINASGSGDVIMINAGGVTISGFTITNGVRGIYATSSSNNDIVGNIISNNNGGGMPFDISYGIHLSQSSNNQIINNSVMYNGDEMMGGGGIIIASSSDNEIIGNNISLNYQFGIRSVYSSNTNISENILNMNSIYGIYLNSSTYHELSGNSMLKNGIMIDGNLLEYWNTHYIDTINQVEAKPVYYWKDVTGGTIPIDTGQVILANCDNIQIENQIIVNGTVGILLGFSSNNFIRNNNISSQLLNGINLYSSTFNDIVDNYILNNARGIALLLSSNNSITNNNLTYNNYHGVLISSSQDNFINNNTISFNTWIGVDLIESSNNNIIADNNITWNGDEGIWVRSSFYNIIVGNNISINEQGISTVFCDNLTIINNTISSNIWEGIQLQSSFCNINGNNIWNNRYGILLSSTINNNLKDNNFIKDGIFVYGSILPHFNSHNISTTNEVSGKPIYYYKDCKGVSIDNIPIGQLILANCSNFNISNLVLDNTDEAIQLLLSNYINIKNISITNNIFGVWFYFSSNISITDCVISSNHFDGIFLRGTSSNIFNNTISLNNRCGLSISSMSVNNQIYHNNFINNSDHVGDGTNNGNRWDNGYPGGGNYWSDYTGVDLNKGPNQNIAGGDGIGDTVYVIDIDSQDNYPLMQPIENYTFLKHGWNLISTPLVQENQNLIKVLEMIDSYYDAVQWYNVSDLNEHWKHFRIGKIFGNDFNEINETKGFWIYLNSQNGAVLLHNGTHPTSNQTIQFFEGWNMVGYPSLSDHNRTVGLNNLEFGIDVDAIQWFDAATKTWHFMNQDDVFVPGRGYWVHSKVEVG
jgi:parallel beta-helix repeat protein